MLGPDEPNEEWNKKKIIAKNNIVELLGDAYLNFAHGSATAKFIIDNFDKIYERQSLATQLA